MSTKDHLTRALFFSIGALISYGYDSSLKAQSIVQFPASLDVYHCLSQPVSIEAALPNEPCTLQIELARYASVLYGEFEGAVTVDPGQPVPVVDPSSTPNRAVLTWATGPGQNVTLHFWMKAARNYVLDNTSPQTLTNIYTLTGSGAPITASSAVSIKGRRFGFTSAGVQVSTGSSQFTRPISIFRNDDNNLPAGTLNPEVIWLVDKHVGSYVPESLSHLGVELTPSEVLTDRTVFRIDASSSPGLYAALTAPAPGAGSPAVVNIVEALTLPPGQACLPFDINPNVTLSWSCSADCQDASETSTCAYNPRTVPCELTPGGQRPDLEATIDDPDNTFCFNGEVPWKRVVTYAHKSTSNYAATIEDLWIFPAGDYVPQFSELLVDPAHQVVIKRVTELDEEILETVSINSLCDPQVFSDRNHPDPVPDCGSGVTTSFNIRFSPPIMLGLGEKLLVEFWHRSDLVDSGPLSTHACGSRAPIEYMFGWDHNVKYTWPCNTELVRVTAYRPYSSSTASTTYVGPSMNVVSPCFIPSPEPNLAKFKFTGVAKMWPGAPNEQVAIDVILTPGTYLAPSDLIDPARAPKLELADGTIYSTAPQGGELPLLFPPELTTFICKEKDCAYGPGPTEQGWLEPQVVRFYLADPDPGTVDQIWSMDDQTRERALYKLDGAELQLRFRMHCPTNVFVDPCCTTCVDCCDQPSMTSVIPEYSSITVRLVHIPDPQCLDGTDGCLDVVARPLSCFSMQFPLQCPGCVNVGIHSNSFDVHRSKYGRPDTDDDGFADGTGNIDPATLDAGTPVMTKRAMFGDEVVAELGTSLVFNCGPEEPVAIDPEHPLCGSAPGYGPCGGTECILPVVDLDHLYYPMLFSSLNIAPGSWPFEVPGDGLPDGLFQPVEVVLSFVSQGPVTSCSPGQVPSCVAAGEEIFRVVINEAALTADLGSSNEIVRPLGSVLNDLDLGKIEFDLSPEALVDELGQFKTGIAQYNAACLAGLTDPPDYRALTGPNKFLFNRLNGYKLMISVKLRVHKNIGPRVGTVRVDNKIYLAARSISAGEFVEADDIPLNTPPGTNIHDCDNLPYPEGWPENANGDPATCCDFKYFCTRKSGFFEVVGFDIDHDPVGNSGRAVCMGGYPQSITVEIGSGAPNRYERDMFPYEYRNWLEVLGADYVLRDVINGTDWDLEDYEVWITYGSRDDPTSPREGRIQVKRGAADWQYDATLDSYTSTLLFQGNCEGGRPPLTGCSATDLEALSVDLCGPGASSCLVLPDDSYVITYRTRTNANCGTPDGGTIIEEVPHYRYKYAPSLLGPLADAVPLSPASGYLGLPFEQVHFDFPPGNLTVAQVGPTVTWEQLLLWVPPDAPWKSYPRLWFMMEEDYPGSSDQMHMEGLEYMYVFSNGPNNIWHDAEPVLDQGGNLIAFSIEPGPGSQEILTLSDGDRVNYKLRITASVDCYDQLAQPPRETDALKLWIGWNCGTEPTPAIGSACSSVVLVADLTQRHLQLPTPLPEWVGCDEVSIRQEVASMDQGSVADLHVELIPGEWEFVEGSATLEYYSQQGVVNAPQALLDPPDLEWDLGEDCPTCDPTAPLFEDGLCGSGSGCTINKLWFTYRLRNCGAQEGSGDPIFRVRSTTCTEVDLEVEIPTPIDDEIAASITIADIQLDDCTSDTELLIGSIGITGYSGAGLEARITLPTGLAIDGVAPAPWVDIGGNTLSAPLASPGLQIALDVRGGVGCNVALSPYTIHTSVICDGCVGDPLAEETAEVNIDQEPLCSVSAEVYHVACHAETTGAVDATVNGTAPYTFAWSGPNGFAANTEDLSSIPAGEYVLLVTDAELCGTSITATVGQPSVPLSATISGQVNASCQGETTGSATVSASGGTPGYTCSWNTIPVQNAATAIDLAIGEYTCTVTDANGCTADVDVTITGSSMSVEVESVPSTCGDPWQVFCGVADVDFDVVGVAVELNATQYRWVENPASLVTYEEGVWTLTGDLRNMNDPNDLYRLEIHLDNPATYPGSWSGDLVGAPLGSNVWSIYSVAATAPENESLLIGLGDNEGNTYDITAAPDMGFQKGIGANAINQYNGVRFRFVATPQGGGTALNGDLRGALFCGVDDLEFSSCSGSISGTITGGTPPYEVTLAGPNFNGTITVEQGEDEFIFPDLCNSEGYEDYVLSVVDAEDCSTQVDNIVLPNEGELLVADVDYTKSTCSSADACAIVSSVTGGQSPYVVVWHWEEDGVSMTSVSEPGVMHCGFPLGKESWVVIYDDNGCWVSYKFFFKNQSVPAQFELNTTASCENTGAVELDPFFDTSQPYSVAWTGPNGFSDEGLTITDLVPGVYEVTVWSFEAGCSWEESVEVQDNCPCEDFGQLQLRTDGNGAHTSWEVLVDGTSEVVCSGSGYPSSTELIMEECCLEDGCYKLKVYDSAGDGMSGAYLLRDPEGKRIIHNSDGFPGALAQHTGVFCLPTGSTALIQSHCDMFWYELTSAFVCSPNTAVSNVFIPGASNGQQSATTGYEFWLFNPDGGYSKTVYQSHQVSNGYPNTATKACHLRLNSPAFTSNPVPSNTLLNIRVRTRLNGVNSAWGPACRVMLGGDIDACWPTQLIDLGTSPLHSCGVTRAFGSTDASQRLNADPVPGGNFYRYWFKLLPNGTPFTILRNNADPSNNEYMPPTWTSGTAPPPANGSTYAVRVQARRLIGGVQTWCSYGEACSVTFTNSAGMAPQGEGTGAPSGGEVLIWPNPNDIGQVYLQLTGFSQKAESVGWQMYDVVGRIVMDQRLPIADGFLSTSVDLPLGISPGSYFIRIADEDSNVVEPLVIE